VLRKKQRITSTEFAKNFADILDRVQHRGERFVIERRGKVVGKIVPETGRRRPLTGDDLCDILESAGPLPSVARAIEDATDALPPLDPPR
jgi:antitoxin (DNA-binding transcriptional repressor) of toxin-antitoxin stability system